MLTTRDNFPIAITYYPSDKGKESPVVILLHGKNSSRLVWKNGPVPQKLLQANGFAVVAVDLRKHGESRPAGAAAGKAADLRPTDYKLMAANDLEAVKSFIFEEHQKQKLNMRKTAVVAPEMSAPIALAWAAADWLKKPHPDAPTPDASTPRGQDVQALVLISPVENLPGLPSGRNLLILRSIDAASRQANIAMLFAYGSGDSSAAAAARSMHKKFGTHRETKDHAFLEPVPSKFSGVNLLGKFYTKKGQRVLLDGVILGFQQTHVAKLAGPNYEWRDRESRLKK